MNISVIAIGKFGRDPENQIVERYLKRLPWKASLIEVAEKRPIKGDERRAREAEQLRGKVPKGAFLVALDETGKELSSKALAGKVDEWRNRGVKTLAFIIGGADGLDPQIRQDADMVLSLSRMTWPHAMVRAMLAEQLYRASSILDGHPYHRG